jgi:hypothetical protein
VLHPGRRHRHGRVRDRRVHDHRGAAGSGITAQSLSTALPVQARDLRLVRVGANELALQFEFANNGDRPITPDALGIDQYQRVLMLVGLPRSTSYETLTAQGNDGRISESNGEKVLRAGRSP